jgi:hypothetical protein
MVAAWDSGGAERHIAWAQACWRALSPCASSGVYVNFLGNEGEERVRAAYGVNYERLVALKNRYDPTNFFSLNQNIRPTVKEPHPLAPSLGRPGSMNDVNRVPRKGSVVKMTRMR